MKVLVLGGSGMLGTDVVSLLRSQRHEVWAPDPHEIDLSQPPAEGFADGFDWVVNCAAYTAVDQAESERDAATVLNEAAPFLVASALGLGTQMIHISTDYVFDGTKQGAYLETDPVCPIGVYGKSKAAGEAALLSARDDSYVLRTAWLYGPHGKCFPKAIINYANSRGADKVMYAGYFPSGLSLERIFTDLMRRCAPERLVVYARYTRRGGLDINPYRSSAYVAPPSNRRTARQ